MRMASASGTCVTKALCEGWTRRKPSLFARQVRQKFRVAGKTCPKNSARLLIGAGRNRVHSAAAHNSTAIHVAAAALPAAPDSSGLNVSGDVIKMVNDRAVKALREGFAAPYDVVAAGEVQYTSGVRKQLCVTYDDGMTRAQDIFFGNGLEDYFRADASRIAHRDADTRKLLTRAQSRRF